MIDIKEFSKPLFSIHTVDGEQGYYAVSDSTPMFCLRSETIAGVSLEAEKVLKSYDKFLKIGNKI